MKSPNPSEKRLLMLLSGVLLLFILIIALKSYLGESKTLAAEIDRLKMAQSGYEDMIRERPYWKAREQWILDHPPQPYQASESESRFAEEVQRELSQMGLSIEKQELHESEHDTGLARMAIDLDVRAPLEKIVRWLQQIQQPGKYYVVQSLNLKRVDDSPAMLARVRLAKLHLEVPAQ